MHLTPQVQRHEKRKALTPYSVLDVPRVLQLRLQSLHAADRRASYAREMRKTLILRAF